MRDLSFLKFKDDDSPELRGMKSYWQMVMDMPEPERKVFLQEERVKDEQRHLEWMIECNKTDDQFIELCKHKARSAVLDYNMLKEESSLEVAELWMETANNTKEGKHTLQDIRKQRERVQWERRKLKTMQPAEEPSTS